MSLINQMLRDLENRQKKKPGYNLLAKEVAAPVEKPAPSRRTLRLAVAGLLLVGLVWLGLELFPVDYLTPKPIIKLVPPDEQSQRIAIVRGQDIFAALEKKNAAEAGRLQPSAAQSTAVRPAGESPAETGKVSLPQQRIASSATESAAPAAALQDNPAAEKVTTNEVAAPPVEPVSVPAVTSAPAQPQQPPEKSRVASGATQSSLLQLGLLERSGSARLMFEFEQMPDFRVLNDGHSGNQLKVLFVSTGMQPALEIPQLKGPLLKRISLQPQGRDLHLTVRLAGRVQMQSLPLPADTFHGDRLLIEVTEEARRKAAPQQARTSNSVAPPLPAKKNSVQVARADQGPDRKQQAEQAYRTALEQLDKGDRPAAEANFTQALILNPRLLEARQQLVGLLLQTQRIAVAQEQLEVGLKLHPDNPGLRKSYARLLLQQENLPGAVNVLLSEPLPEVVSDLEYHALLAALQQEAGQHMAAARRYAQLLEVRPREALWWMGMAIALEQAGDSVQASKAYRQALVLPGLRPDLSHYVRERLQSL